MVAGLIAHEKQEDPRDAFGTARQWQQTDYLFSGMHYLSNLYPNRGLKLGPADPVQRTAFNARLAGNGRSTEMQPEKYALSASSLCGTAVPFQLLRRNLSSFSLTSGVDFRRGFQAGGRRPFYRSDYPTEKS